MNQRPQKAKISCECGKTYEVSFGSAGDRWACDCGRTVNVPSLAELRKSVGLAEIPRSPAEIVRSMVSNNSLPISVCHCCSAENTELIPLIAVCERSSTHASGTVDAVDARRWGLLVPGAGVLMNRNKKEVVTLGRNVAVAVPIRLCPVCRTQLPNNQTISRALRAAKWISFFSMLVALFTPDWRWLVLVFAPAILVFQMMEWVSSAWQNSSYRVFLSTVPSYKDLFRQYPRATVGQFSPELLRDEW